MLMIRTLLLSILLVLSSPALAEDYRVGERLTQRKATPAQARAIDAASVRLIAPDQMGTLFRVLALGDGLKNLSSRSMEPSPATLAAVSVWVSPTCWNVRLLPE